MRAARSVKANPRNDPYARLAAGVEIIEVDAFILQRAPQSLDEDVGHPAPAVLHGHRDASLFTLRPEGGTSELAAFVGMEDLRPAMEHNRLVKRFNAEQDLCRVRQVPGQHVPTGQIHDCNEITKARRIWIWVKSVHKTWSGLSMTRPRKR